jgi:hypothetical protein
MTSPLPTSPAMEQLVGDLLRTLPPHHWADVSRRVALIRREQDHLSIESVDRVTSTTHPDPAQTTVFDLTAFRAARVEAHDPTDPEAA